MLGWVWLKKMDNLSYISRVLFEIISKYLSGICKLNHVIVLKAGIKT